MLAPSEGKGREDEASSSGKGEKKNGQRVKKNTEKRNKSKMLKRKQRKQQKERLPKLRRKQLGLKRMQLKQRLLLVKLLLAPSWHCPTNHWQAQKKARCEIDETVHENLCCVCFGSYDEDIGTGREWVECSCKRWLHEDCVDEEDMDSNGKLCPLC